MIIPATYFVYLVISLTLTVWVARTLHQRGRIFLVECFRRNEELADSVNDLLVVGFYLINFGYVVVAMRYGAKPGSLTESIELLSTKIGIVLLFLGGMHFMNMLIFGRLRRGLASKKRPLGDSPFLPAGACHFGNHN